MTSEAVLPARTRAKMCAVQRASLLKVGLWGCLYMSEGFGMQHA